MRQEIMKKTKIVFAGHDLKFAQLIMDYLEKEGSYDLRVDQWTGHNVHNTEQSKAYLAWADVIVCEWGLGNAVWYSHHKLPHQRLIVRMHRQELDTIYPKQFYMDNIDAIVAISPHIYEEFYRAFKIPREKMYMLFNTLDAEALNKEKEDTNTAKYHLGIIGICPKMKRLDLAVDILEKLWLKDSRYKLFVKGKLPQDYSWLWKKEEERQYYENLFERINAAPWKDAVVFDGFGSDMDEWFKKIGFVLSTSDFESFHLAPSEGMASGAYPIILNWDGSDTIYSSHYLLQDVDECVTRIEEINALDDEQMERVREEVKEYASNFDIRIVGARWHSLLQQLTTV
jgi:glycosyltransferase involved in cell wall biosynthesis